jgi:hypothetical protein
VSGVVGARAEAEGWMIYSKYKIKYSHSSYISAAVGAKIFDPYK